MLGEVAEDGDERQGDDEVDQVLQVHAAHPQVLMLKETPLGRRRRRQRRVGGGGEAEEAGGGDVGADAGFFH